MANSEASTISSRVGFYAALFMPIITLVTFGFAIVAIPISGANCLENCSVFDAKQYTDRTNAELNTAC